MATAGDIETPPAPVTPPTPTDGVNRSLAANGNVAVGGNGGGPASAFRKWKNGDFRVKLAVGLRAMTWLFSLIAAIVMATNKHGNGKEFNNYEEYKYLVAIDFLVFLYSWIQLARFSSRRDFVAKQFAGMFDFVGDQVVAYLLMSAMSAAIPMTNRMREGADNMFTDASVASISMTFFAFASSAVSALISGYKFSRQNINIHG